MKTEFRILDTDGHIICNNEIQLSHIDGDKDCNKRIIMITQDNETRISIMFELEDGKIVNPKLMNVVSSENGLTLMKD